MYKRIYKYRSKYIAESLTGGNPVRRQISCSLTECTHHYIPPTHHLSKCKYMCKYIPIVERRNRGEFVFIKKWKLLNWLSEVSLSEWTHHFISSRHHLSNSIQSTTTCPKYSKVQMIFGAQPCHFYIKWKICIFLIGDKVCLCNVRTHHWHPVNRNSTAKEAVVVVEQNSCSKL